MPIELRPSDVMGQVAETFRRTSQSLLGIRRDIYEAERVSQVNQGLAFFEQSFFEYEQELSKQQFEVPLEDSTELFKSTADPKGGTILKPLGEANWGAVEQNYADYVDKQLDYVTKTVTNKQARRELIQHLELGSVAHKRRVQSSWEEAADHAERASLNQLIEVVMQSNVPWERKVSEVSSRVDAMVKAGRLWKDEGEKVKREITTAAQYSHAANGTMDAMKNGFVYEDPEGKEHIVEPGMDAGETWLNINTPFYDGNPDARAQILNEVRREYDYDRRMEDEQLDRDFSDMHIGADTLEKVDRALAALTPAQFYDGDKKYIWETRLRAKREHINALKGLPKSGRKTVEDSQKATYGHALARVTTMKHEGKTSYQAIRTRIVDPLYYNYVEDADGKIVQAPLISPTDYTKLCNVLEAKDDPIFKIGVDYLKDVLEDEALADAMIIYNEWWPDAGDPKNKEVLEAAKNIADRIVVDKLDKFSMRRWRNLTEDIQEGEFIGLADEFADELLIYNAGLIQVAKREYPHVQISDIFTDPTGAYGEDIQPGSALLVNPAGIAHVFKIEDKEFVLYQLTLNKEGTYDLKRVPKPVPQSMLKPEKPEKPIKPITMSSEEAYARRLLKLGDEMAAKEEAERIEMTRISEEKLKEARKIDYSKVVRGGGGILYLDGRMLSPAEIFLYNKWLDERKKGLIQ